MSVERAIAEQLLSVSVTANSASSRKVTTKTRLCFFIGTQHIIGRNQ